jgi:hypothetical protein
VIQKEAFHRQFYFIQGGDMKKYLILILLPLLSVSAMAQGVRWFEGSFDEALAQSAEEDKPVLLFMFSPA